MFARRAPASKWMTELITTLLVKVSTGELVFKDEEVIKALTLEPADLVIENIFEGF